MTLRTFSSILPFTRRFGVRGVTCMTNGAEGGGGGGASKPNDDAPSNAKARWSLARKLQGKRKGVATKDLIEKVRQDYPGEFEKSEGSRAIRGALQHMKDRGDAEKIGFALWRLSSADDKASAKETPGRNEMAKYKLVAEHLVSSGECASARITGDDRKPGKWSNPDVVGAVMPNKTAMCNGFAPKLMAVEVKDATDASALFGGFAQACAYQGFAHMTYLMVPWCDNNNITRVSRLCRTNGVGLAFICEEGGDEWLDFQIPARDQEPDPDQFEDFLNHLGITRIEQLRSKESSPSKGGAKKSAKRRKKKKRPAQKANSRSKKKG